MIYQTDTSKYRIVAEPALPLPFIGARIQVDGVVDNDADRRACCEGASDAARFAKLSQRARERGACGRGIPESLEVASYLRILLVLLIAAMAIQVTEAGSASVSSTRSKNVDTSSTQEDHLRATVFGVERAESP